MGEANRRKQLDKSWGQPTTETAPLSGQASLLLAAMAVKALNQDQPGAVWKKSLPDGYASIEFMPASTIALKTYHEVAATTDFATHRILAWENRQQQDVIIWVYSLEKLETLTGLLKSE